MGGYTADWELYFSEQEIIDEEEAKKLQGLLRLNFGSYGKTRFTLDQLRRITKIINE